MRRLTEFIAPIVILACIAGFATVPALGQTYKWKDADGKIHYSDQPPPPGAKEEATVKRKPGAQAPAPAGDAKAAPAANKAKTYQEQEAEFRKRQVEAAEKDAAERKKAAEEAEKKQNCAKAQAQVATLQAGGRVTRVNANGEKEYLSDAQIAQDLESARKSVASWCN